MNHKRITLYLRDTDPVFIYRLPDENGFAHYVSQDYQYMFCPVGFRVYSLGQYGYNDITGLLVYVVGMDGTIYKHWRVFGWGVKN